MTPSQIFKDNNVLTLEIAKGLKGKKIACTSPEYHANSCHVSTFIVGDIITELENAFKAPYPDQGGRHTQHETFGHYWESYMSTRQLDGVKTKMCLLDEAGKKQYVCHTKYGNFYDEPTFTGSDADREVYYILLD